jgi:hypothetical protein
MECKSKPAARETRESIQKQRLKNTLLNDMWVIEEIGWEI